MPSSPKLTSPIAPSLSSIELTQRILEMAETGVYRESLFTTFQSLATRRQVRSAIAEAKQFGLYSVASLRDAELGTYYQADPQQVQKFKIAMATAAGLEDGEDWGQRLVTDVHTIRAMLVVAGGGALALFLMGSFWLLQGQLQAGRTSWLLGVMAGSIWAVQQTLASRVLR